MNTLSGHILSLLRLYDKVALPGMGYFMIRYVGASFEEETLTFFPPYYRLSFFPDAEAKGKVLADSFIRKDGITKNEAHVRINELTKELSHRLEKGEEVILSGLGRFTLQEGKLEFKANYLLNPPLPVICLQEQSEESPVDEILQQSENSLESQGNSVESEEEPTTKSEPEIIERHIEVVPEHYHYHKPDYYYLPIHKRIADIAACILLVVIVGIATLMPGQSSCSTASTASILPLTSEESPKDIKADTKMEADIKVEESRASLPAKSSVAMTDEGEPVPGSNYLSTKPYLNTENETDSKYFAVVAAFKYEKEVRKFIDSAKGNFEILKKPNIYYVTVASAADKEELQASMPLIRSTYPDAWIYTKP